MLECQLVHELERREAENRKLARRLQPAAASQLVELLATSRVRPDSDGDDGMRSSKERLGKGKGPFPRPLPKSNSNPKTKETNIATGTANGGTSTVRPLGPRNSSDPKRETGMISKQLRQIDGKSVFLMFILCWAPINLTVGAYPTPSGTERLFTVADDIGMSHFAESPIAFSPNRRYFIVQTERGLLNLNQPESTLRVYETEALQKILLKGGTLSDAKPVWTITKSTYKDGPIVTSLKWLADSSGFAFLVKTSSGRDQLLIADVHRHILEPLTPSSQHVTGFDIRDRRHFVYAILSPSIGAPKISAATSTVGTGRSMYELLFPTDFVLLSNVYDLGELWAVVEGRRFRVQDRLRPSEPMSIYYWGQRTLALSPDGRFVITALAFPNVPEDWPTLYPSGVSSAAYQIRPGVQAPTALSGYLYALGYALVDLHTGETKFLTNAPIGVSAAWVVLPGAAWSANGKSVVLVNTFLSESSERNPRQHPCVAVVDLEKDSQACIQQLKKHTDKGFRRIHKVYFESGNNTKVNIEYCADCPNETVTYSRNVEGVWNTAVGVERTTNEKTAVHLSIQQDLNREPELIATDVGTGKAGMLWDPNPQFKSIALGEESVLKWKDQNGRDWVGGLFRPPGYVQGHHYPLVIQTHGFSEHDFEPSGAFPTAFAARELSAAGIVVLQVRDCPASVDSSEAACQIAGYESAVDQLAADGIIDRSHVGIIGFSRTCYYVLGALTNSRLHIEAASITDGVQESYLQYIINVDTLDNILSREAEAIIGSRPFGDGLQQWLKRSPGFNLDKVHAPLQIVAIGRASLLFEMLESYAGLRYLHKPVDLIVLGEGTHILSNPAQRMVSQGGSVDWFRFWLKGEEDPDPAKVGQYARWRELRRMQELIQAR